jgi:anamorsin
MSKRKFHLHKLFTIFIRFIGMSDTNDVTNVLVLDMTKSLTASTMETGSKKFVFIGSVDELSKLSPNQFNEVKFSGLVPDETILGQVLNVLKPLGKFAVEGLKTREIGQALALDLKIQGFLDIMVAKGDNDERFVVCQKPDWEIGAVAKVEIATKSANSSGVVESKKWKMDADDLADSDLIDESDLLDKNFVIPKESSCGEAGAGGKKRACKDCTCGLAEQERAESGSDATAAGGGSGTIEEKVVRASGCGNCSKGDAFRCGGCPFLGKPTFEPGQERVVLANMADDF